jgi:DNA primase
MLEAGLAVKVREERQDLRPLPEPSDGADHRSARQHVIGFGGRVLDDSEAEISQQSGDADLQQAQEPVRAERRRKKAKLGMHMILTEGYMDAIALHQYGFDCAVASLGTSLTEEQASHDRPNTRTRLF